MSYSSPATPSSNNGSYAGNDGVNRAIPHGLRKVPTSIELRHANSTYWYTIIKGYAYILYLNESNKGKYAVTAVDATNFYVGNAGNTNQSANETGSTYYWIATA